MADFIFKKVASVDSPNFVMHPVDLISYFPQIKSFKLKRFYWISNTKNKKETGQHAHSDENGIFMVLSGKAKMVLSKDGKKVTKSVVPGNIVWVPKYCWHGFINMSQDFILLVLSDKNYDHNRKGYIMDINQI